MSLKLPKDTNGSRRKFKADAVQMLLDGHTGTSVVDRLGLSGTNLLNRWKREQLQKSGPVASSLDSRVKKLEIELRRVSTDTSMSVDAILKIVSDRWSIEEHFHDVKEIWGAGEQQVRNVWSSIGCWHVCGWLYTLVELPTAESLRQHAPATRHRDRQVWQQNGNNARIGVDVGQASSLSILKAITSTGWKPVLRRGDTMNEFGVFRRRHMPHWDVEGHPVFITGCLDGSIPAAGLQRIRQYREELEARARPTKFSADQWRHHIEKLVFAFVDNLLDQESPVTHLKDDRQAKIVRDAFLHFADERYKLFAFVVMPSHHHWLFLPEEKWSIEAVKASSDRTPREIISHSIQSYTANQCNRIRGASGTYWQDETFDHWVRDEAELLRIIQYIENNPLVAGLVDRPEDYKWSSARLRSDQGIKPGEPITR